MGNESNRLSTLLLLALEGIEVFLLQIYLMKHTKETLIWVCNPWECTIWKTEGDDPKAWQEERETSLGFSVSKG